MQKNANQHFFTTLHPFGARQWRIGFGNPLSVALMALRAAIKSTRADGHRIEFLFHRRGARPGCGGLVIVNIGSPTAVMRNEISTAPGRQPEEKKRSQTGVGANPSRGSPISRMAA